MNFSTGIHGDDGEEIEMQQLPLRHLRPQRHPLPLRPVHSRAPGPAAAVVRREARALRRCRCGGGASLLPRVAVDFLLDVHGDSGNGGGEGAGSDGVGGSRRATPVSSSRRRPPGARRQLRGAAPPPPAPPG